MSWGPLNFCAGPQSFVTICNEELSGSLVMSLNNKRCFVAHRKGLSILRELMFLKDNVNIVYKGKTDWFMEI